MAFNRIVYLLQKGKSEEIQRREAGREMTKVKEKHVCTVHTLTAPTNHTPHRRSERHRSGSRNGVVRRRRQRKQEKK